MNRLYMDEAVDAGGEGGGGGAPAATADNGGTPVATADNGGTPAESGGDKGGGKGENHNALATLLDGEAQGKGTEAGDPGKGGQGEAETAKPGEKPQDDKGELTKEAAKAYVDALKLDEATFGKGRSFDERYVAKLPELFHRYGISPEVGNALANDFTRIQKEVNAERVKEEEEFTQWRNGEIQRMNEEFFKKYDKNDQKNIINAVNYFFKKGSPMYGLVRESEVGVDPGFLEVMRFAGERLPKNGAPGAGDGAGTSSDKGLAASFMGK